MRQRLRGLRACPGFPEFFLTRSGEPGHKAAMPVTCHIEIKSDYLIATLSGERDPERAEEEILDAWREIYRRCDARGVDRILCIHSVSGQIPDDVIIRNVPSLRRLGFKKGYRLALVAYSGDLIHTADLIERLARQEGYVIKFFMTTAKAEEWLTSTL